MLNNIKVLTHSSIRIQSPEGPVVYVDPYNIKNEPHDADLILVTHSHRDHFSPKDIAKIVKTECGQILTEIYMPYDKSQDSLGCQVTNVEPDFDYEAKGIIFETIPAYNVGKKFHPKDNEWVGYILDIDGTRIYIAGDTDITEENQNVQCDIALVPVGGTYTMSPQEAAKLINIIKPKYAIPTHYGSVVGSEDDAKEFASLVEPQIQVEIKKEQGA